MSSSTSTSTSTSSIEVVEQQIQALIGKNKEYQNTYHAVPKLKDFLAMEGRPPTICIVACLDPRVIPEKIFDLGVGECAVLRNAGGRTLDAVRSLAVLDQAVGIGAVLILHHTDCGLSNFSDCQIKSGLRKVAPSESYRRIDGMQFGEILGADFETSLRNDTEHIRRCGFFRENMLVRGYLYDVETGKVEEVCRA